MEQLDANRSTVGRNEKKFHANVADGRFWD